MKKTVIIIGGSDGIGFATAKLLAPLHNIIILSHGRERVETAAQEAGCFAMVSDVTVPATLTDAFTTIEKKHGGIDVVINCAGVWAEGPLDENDEDAIKRVIEVNLLGTINSCQAALRIMKKKKSGLIININSQSGLYYKAERAAYHASKWGVTGLTGSLQQEVAKYGIRVTGFYPAKINTALFAKVGIKKSKDNALEVEEVAQALKFIIDMPDHLHIPEFGLKHIAG